MLRRTLLVWWTLLLLDLAWTTTSAARSMQGDSLYLADVLALVAANDATLARQKARTEQVRAQVIEVAAFLDPTLRLSAETSRAASMLAGREPAAEWTTSYSASVVHHTSLGLAVAPYATVSVAPELTGIPSSFGLDLSFPLFQLGGRNPSAVLLRAYRLRHLAAEQQTRHVRAQELYLATLAYWEYRAGHARLAILGSAEHRAADVLRIIERLVAAGERAAVDVAQAEAFAADRRRERAGAEQQLRAQAARIAELTALPLDELVHAVPAREVASPVAMDASASGRGMEETLRERADLASLRTGLVAERLLARNRASDLLPAMEVSARIGQTVGGTGALPRGGFASVSVALTGSMLNRHARSRLYHQRAIAREQRLVFEHEVRQARVSLDVAIAAVSNAQRESEAARDAVGAHQQAVENVRRTLEAGFATLFDVILAEDRLTSARLALVAANARLGQAVARLAFEQGAVSGEGPTAPADWAKRLLGAERVRP